jgi:hypothetical protein
MQATEDSSRCAPGKRAFPRTGSRLNFGDGRSTFRTSARSRGTQRGKDADHRGRRCDGREPLRPANREPARKPNCEPIREPIWKPISDAPDGICRCPSTPCGPSRGPYRGQGTPDKKRTRARRQALRRSSMGAVRAVGRRARAGSLRRLLWHLRNLRPRRHLAISRPVACRRSPARRPCRRSRNGGTLWLLLRQQLHPGAAARAQTLDREA